MRFLLVLISLIGVFATAGFIDYQKHSVPMVRTDPANPVFTLANEGEVNAVKQGKIVLRMGPWLYGLRTGTTVFSSKLEAQDFMQQHSEPAEKWHVFLLSGDYTLDVKDGVLNKTLKLVKEIP